MRKAGAGNMLFTMPGPPQPLGPGGKAIPQNIEYTQYMQGSLHSNDFGQHLGGDRIGDKLLGVSLATTDPKLRACSTSTRYPSSRCPASPW